MARQFSEEWLAERMAKPAKVKRFMLQSLPEDIDSNRNEHEHQSALFKWAKLNAGLVPELGRMFAVPNAGNRTRGEASYMLSEGLKKGVPDIFLLTPRRGYHGLIIEMKSRFGIVRPSQREWIEWFEAQKYLTNICYSFQSARDVILMYLGIENDG